MHLFQTSSHEGSLETCKNPRCVNFFKPLAQKMVTIDQDLNRTTRNSRPCSKLPKLARMFFSSLHLFPNSITGTKLSNLQEMQRMLNSFATITIDRDLKSCNTIRTGLGRCCCAGNEWIYEYLDQVKEAAASTPPRRNQHCVRPLYSRLHHPPVAIKSSTPVWQTTRTKFH